MSEKLSDSIKYIMNEYKRLIDKENKGVLTSSEKETLKNLKKFLGKN